VRRSVHNADPIGSSFPPGRQLYGEQLTPERAIERWNEQTNAVHGALLAAHGRAATVYQQRCPWIVSHAVGKLLRGRYECCVALGCAEGDDVSPLAGVVRPLYCHRAARAMLALRDRRQGGPISPAPACSGTLRSAIAASIWWSLSIVLHHIANVEPRTLASWHAYCVRGGLLVVRDPISWMGDWRQPRRGLTANERGLPLAWFEQAAAVSCRLSRSYVDGLACSRRYRSIAQGRLAARWHGAR